ncbi:SDR family NAD(P)-dependent oxidoreductase [Roseovarius sp.]|uniref:SDR family NAD(P)-dependent oxidoreductase n=1 Tax=Roseovarius sp. TaxID=1486281 RepID=UPI003B5A37FB
MTGTDKRRALVTGGNRGIGRAIAEGLVKAGLDVTIGVRDVAGSRAVADEIEAGVVACDLAGPDDALPDAGAFDVLVNNAGVLFDAPILSPEARFDEVMAVMLRGPYLLIRRAVPDMTARGYGRVVNLSSDWGSFSEGLDGPGAYGVAKAALNALTLAASREAGAGVKINAMCPGWVRTRMGGAAAARSPAEGAETALWLATLPADGPTGGFFRDRAPLGW